MKKIIIFLSLAILFIGFKPVLAWDNGCSSAGPYSITTGQLCAVPVPPVCAVGDLYSYVTGQLCSEILNPTPVIVSQPTTPIDTTTTQTYITQPTDTIPVVTPSIPVAPNVFKFPSA